MTEQLSRDDLFGYLEETLDATDHARVRAVLVDDPAARDALEAEAAIMQDVSNVLFDTLSGQFPAAGKLRFEPIADAMAHPKQPMDAPRPFISHSLRLALAAVILAAVGAGTWLFADPSRQDTVSQHVAAAVPKPVHVPTPDEPREDPLRDRALELLPEGWIFWAEDSVRRPFEAGVDRVARTFVLRARQREGRAWVRQVVDARARYQGQRMRFAAALRTLASDDDARLCIWVDERLVACGEMPPQPQRSTDAWRRGEVVVDVSSEAKTFAFGVVIVGRGVEFKDLAVDAVDPAVFPTTVAPSKARMLPTQPMNLAP